MTVELVVDDTGLFEPADVHVGQRLTALREETDERVALAVAFVVRALRGGSVCVDPVTTPSALALPGSSGQIAGA